MDIAVLIRKNLVKDIQDIHVSNERCLKLDLRIYPRDVTFLIIYVSTDLTQNERGIPQNVGSAIRLNKITTYIGRRFKRQSGNLDEIVERYTGKNYR